MVRAVLCACALLATSLARPAAAQDRPGPALELAAGWVGFADDGIVSESLVGGVVRLYLLPRISVGPEIVYLAGPHHSHLVITGNLTFDFLAPANGRPRRVTPFVVAGGGLYQTRETFFTGPYTSSEGAFTAGGGVRARLGDRAIVGVDMRIGWELHIRVNGVVGLQLGR